MRSIIKKRVLNSGKIYSLESVYPKYKLGIVYTYYTFLVLLCVTSISGALKYMPKELAMFIVAVTIITFIVLCVTLNRVFSRGNPLVFTEAGIFLEPYFYESWEDICGYSFKKYDGVFRTTLSAKGTGITLLIFNNGVNQRTINLRGHSFTATCGIFFGTDKIEIIEKIFGAHGIERRILSDEL